MDTTKEYIKMSEKAKEIQKEWKPQIGDYIGGEWFVDDNTTRGLCCKGIIRGLNPEGKSDCVDTGGGIFWCIKSHIWLPAQADLQAMLELKLGDLLDKFNVWEEGCGWIQERDNFTSMEQLWLAFYMHTQYNKVWLNGDWVKE